MSAADEKRPPLHEATLRLLSLLATSRLEKDLLQKGIEALAAILQARYGAIGLVDDAGKLRQFVYTGIGPEEAASIGKLPEGRGLLGITAPLRLSDMSRDPRAAGFPPHHPPMKSLLSVSFSHEGHNYGRVYLSEKFDGSDFDEEDEQLLSHFASVFAMMLAYHRAQNEAELERRQRELDLQASEANLRALAENAGEGILVNMDGRHVFANRRLAEMLGYRNDEELLHTTIGDIVHPDELARVSERFRQRMAGEKVPSQYETVFVTKQGQAVPVEISATITAWQGKPAGLIFVRDITERRRTEEELRMRAELLDNANDSIFVVDLEGNFIYANKTAWKSRGYTRDELMGMNLRTLDTPEYARLIPLHMRKILTEGQNTFESAHHRKDGSVMPVEVNSRVFEWHGKQILLAAVRDITERKLAEDRMRQLSSAVEQTADSVVITDPNGVIQYVNPAHQSTTGYSPEEAIGNTPRLVKSGQHGPAFYDRLWETIQRGEVFRERFINRKKDGSLYHEEKTITPLKNARGEITHFVSTGKDITQHVRVEKTLRENNEILERIFDSTHFCLAYLDRDFNFIRVNRAYAKVCGYPPEHFPSKNHFQMYPHQENEAIFRRVVQTGEPFTTIAKPFEFPDHPEWGVTYWDWTLHPLKDAAGNVEALLFVLLDVTERRRTEDQLNALAYYDALTGLPNRQQLHDHLEWVMKEAANRDRLVAILFLDLDRFKNINDTLGHDMGDALLKEVAARLRASIRPGDIIARLGGDEFTLVLANVAHVDDVTRVAQKLLDQFLPPFRIGGRDLFITPSIGITLYPLDDNSPENLLKNADIAMYHAKELGRNNFQFYTAELNVRAARRLELETGLRRALERNEFVLHFQPLVKMNTGKIAGMEALLRWRHPEYGLIPPMEFIPLAEETGLIVPIGEWVLRAACAQIRAWHATGFPPMHVAVNLSSVQLRQKNFAATVKRALKDAGLEPRYLDLELTESLLMQDMEAAEAILKELNDFGVLFSLDDFGTGYSSLSYLKRFPIDFLKIDRSFVRDITHDRYGAGIVRAIIVMAHTLGIKVIAEGVETVEHLRFLREQGCDISQGYYCSEPLDTGTFTDLLRDWSRIRRGKCSVGKAAAKPRKKQTGYLRRSRK